jgi:hypothetical protein
MEKANVIPDSIRDPSLREEVLLQRRHGLRVKPAMTGIGCVVTAHESMGLRFLAWPF